MVIHVRIALKKARWSVVLVPCLLVALVASPLVVAAQGWRSPWHTYTTADGLASDMVNAIHQGEDGVMWFGTSQGLTRYDGEWETYTVADGLARNEVTAIYRDDQGVLWAGTRGGISRCDRESLTWVSPDDLLARDVSAIGQLHDGTLWFGTLDEGIGYLEDGEWRAFVPASESDLPSSAITAAAEGAQGMFWVGTPLGLARYDGTEWEVYTTADGLADDLVTAVLPARDGTVWVGTLRGLSRFNPGADGSDWETYLAEDGLAGEHVTALVEDAGGTLWVGTTEGLSLYDGREWQVWTQEDGLVSNEIRAVYEDSDGGLWFGTNGGVSHCDTTWRIFSLPQGQPDDRSTERDVSDLARASDGALWVTTLGAGVFRYERGHWDTYTTSQGLASDQVFAMAEDSQGALWFGTAGGVSRYAAGGWKTYTETLGLPATVVLSIAAAGDGTLWFGTAGGGAAGYQPGGSMRVFTQADGLADDYVHAISSAQDGAMWFGTSRGLSRFDGLGWEVFTAESTGGELPGDEIRDIWPASDGSLWFATDRGAAHYDGHSWQTFTRQEGLPASGVNAIWEEQGTVWFGTSGGLCRYDGETIQVYTPHHGLPNSHILSILHSAPQTWWFGTTAGGLVRYQAERTRPWARVNRINDHSVVTDTVTLNAEEKNIVMSFAGGDVHTDSDQLLYVYRLDSVDAEWRKTGDRFALYYDLMPGSYVLWLMARDVNLNYSEPYSVMIIIPAEAQVGAAVQRVVPGATAVPAPTGSLPAPTVHSSPATAAPTPALAEISRGLLALAGESLWPGSSAAEPVAQSAPAAPPAELDSSTPVETFPRMALPWTYALLGVPVLAVVAAGYWSYGQWRARQAAGRDFNPYICGPPIQDERMFFGRTDLLRDILQVIHNNNIIIYGERRIGKTTLLYQLGQRLRRLDDPEYAFFPVFINLQGIPQDRLFLLLGQSVARQMENEVGALGLLCSPAGRKEGARLFPAGKSAWQPNGTNYTNFDLQEDLNVVVEALQKTTSKAVRLIFLVDEADVINTYDQAVQEQLRGVLMSSLAQHIKMVIAGTYISKEWHLQSSPWYNLFSREIMVPPFEDKEIRRLIKRPVEGIYRYDQDAINQIIAYSDRKPFEAQQLCLHAVRETLAQNRRQVTASEVEAALKNSLDERSLEFEQLWEAMSPDGRRALEVLMKNAASTVADGARVVVRSRAAVARLPLSDEDRRLLLQGGVLYRYDKRERLLTSFQEWIKRVVS